MIYDKSFKKCSLPKNQNRMNGENLKEHKSAKMRVLLVFCYVQTKETNFSKTYLEARFLKPSFCLDKIMMFFVIIVLFFP